MFQQYNPEGDLKFEVVTIRPRQVVVVGQLDQLCGEDGRVNPEKASSFELYRRDHQDVEILTFDELYERARFIVESTGARQD